MRHVLPEDADSHPHDRGDAAAAVLRTTVLQLARRLAPA
jgi:hypothetical protein